MRKVVPGQISELSKRTRAVLSSLRCDWDQLSDMLRYSWKARVIPCEVSSVDEAIFAYQPRGKQASTCPKRYIPRKPHLNGLLCYLNSFKTNQRQPFVFDIEPDLKKDSPLNLKTVIQSMATQAQVSSSTPRFIAFLWLRPSPPTSSWPPR